MAKSGSLDKTMKSVSEVVSAAWWKGAISSEQASQLTLDIEPKLKAADSIGAANILLKELAANLAKAGAFGNEKERQEAVDKLTGSINAYIVVARRAAEVNPFTGLLAQDLKEQIHELRDNISGFAGKGAGPMSDFLEQMQKVREFQRRSDLLSPLQHVQDAFDSARKLDVSKLAPAELAPLEKTIEPMLAEVFQLDPETLAEQFGNDMALAVAAMDLNAVHDLLIKRAEFELELKLPIEPIFKDEDILQQQQKLLKTLEGALPKFELKNPSIALKDSREAVSSIIRFRREEQAGDPIQQLVEQARAAAHQRDIQADLARRLLQAQENQKTASIGG